RSALHNLASLRISRPVLPYPRSRRAAVLIALFVGRMGDLYVLLSRRAATLRTYAGDTALPGGKLDREDSTIEDTARREAYEEIGLPRDKQRIPLLCVLDPFLAGNEILVTPVVVLILDNTVRPILNAPEVHTLFSHPLASFLSTSAPFATDTASGTDVSSDTDTNAERAASATRIPERFVRMHRFLTGRESGGIKPVFGLTAAILIHTAALAYARPPAFDVYAPHQPSTAARVAWALRYVPALRQACIAEGMDPDGTASVWEPDGLREASKKRSARKWAKL
ncbi:hypothetical protein HETIRDRAFT_314160, partial [Heterobasidion irregulare TC 32-1]